MPYTIEILEEKRNPIIDRVEIKFRVDHFAAGTPNRLDVKKKIATMKKSNKNLTIIKELKTHFGASYAIGKVNITLKTSAIAAIVNICLNIILIPKYGIVGGALATIISLMFSMSFVLIMLIKIAKIKINFYWMILGFSSFLIISIIYLFINILNQYILIIILFPIYILIIYLGRIITQEDTQFIRKNIFK